MGFSLGTTMDYQVIATEGWGNAGGKSQYTIAVRGDTRRGFP
jgi:endo-1,4-beta-xylanase